ncbi:hypothetical protein TREMEDRAFT_64809 [Tremella mesenterica DSM 1558]|uniref:uncharacterized protein n=1 Tax=Tremella mesenterica (strain ATCC 24925 / CBS 8224 / DSM 1558 / NBRC 9311 / NRRL Y-6157 / RJB 2259-6 / UBC 559-6) TaxID=578456 RepID=UPI0003F48EC0|nr:uncharacterized protein TREMEDRAFT_64809 [Tremella mesenterica DSM 1558]EIW66950.1 hypothetical protein TREMEDRAFT_64809 [Tremella mesenterica DSM 1558]
MEIVVHRVISSTHKEEGLSSDYNTILKKLWLCPVTSGGVRFSGWVQRGLRGQLAPKTTQASICATLCTCTTVCGTAQSKVVDFPAVTRRRYQDGVQHAVVLLIAPGAPAQYFTLNDSEQEYQPHVESGNAHAGNLDFSIPSPLRTRAPRPFLGGGPTLEETQDNSVGRPMISGSIHSSTADTVVPILHPNESGSLSQLRVGSRLEDDELMWEEGQNFTAGSAEEDIPLGTSGRPRKGSYLPIPHTREVKRKGFETFTDDDSEPAQSPDNDSSFNERWEKPKGGKQPHPHGGYMYEAEQSQVQSISRGRRVASPLRATKGGQSSMMLSCAWVMGKEGLLKYVAGSFTAGGLLLSFQSGDQVKISLEV